MEEVLFAIRNLVKECRLNDIKLIALVVDEESRKKLESEVPDTDIEIKSESVGSIEIRVE